jgi:hypothetical protein
MDREKNVKKQIGEANDKLCGYILLSTNVNCLPLAITTVAHTFENRQNISDHSIQMLI